MELLKVKKMVCQGSYTLSFFLTSLPWREIIVILQNGEV